ncbi:Energy-coupling factor transporter ATP-binding protein EcfA1 [Baekduia alba]|uniref:ATP-binding cassette domain-containing protein n=1 Tax=Baekduia alba TaxID=2997333 RepID=UPI0023412AF7|nr:ATP-binding cassette domain-containing protein [Baekduia alba]WCB96408.1 Energy-coupling factor transporter ATP-binding protein EcfA1 [Baekduia alba]
MELVRVESVGLTYWRGRRSARALVDVSMELHAGELAGVWGRRAAGKSTLAQVVAGILAPTTGSVTFDGQTLTSSVDGRPRHLEAYAEIGFAARRGPELEEMAVEDWLASALLTSCARCEALRRVRVALGRVGADDIGGEAWCDLSDGERMLAAIAQAIVRGPRLLVVDDAVAGLAATERSDIMNLLASVAATGVAVLVTAAELMELQGADRIWSIREGRLDGPSTRSAGSVIPLRPTGAGTSVERKP